jgi:hypothetical protein
MRADGFAPHIENILYISGRSDMIGESTIFMP